MSLRPSSVIAITPGGQIKMMGEFFLEAKILLLSLNTNQLEWQHRLSLGIGL
jgi:hypothetical protein